jgi:hypothetical protein
VTLVLCDLDKGRVAVLAPPAITSGMRTTNSRKEVTVRTNILVTVVCAQTLRHTSRSNAITNNWIETGAICFTLAYLNNSEKESGLFLLKFSKDKKSSPPPPPLQFPRETVFSPASNAQNSQKAECAEQNKRYQKTLIQPSRF